MSGETSSENLRPVLIIIAILLFVIAAGMCLISYEIVMDISAKKKAEAVVAYTPSQTETEIGLAKNTLYDGGVVSEIIFNVNRREPAMWTYFFTNTGRHVVQVEGTFDDPKKFRLAIDSPRANLAYKDIADYSNEDIISASYRIQFVKQLDVENKTKYNNYRVSYTEYILEIKGDDGKVRTEKVDGYAEWILDHMEAYLQDTSLNDF